MVLDDSEKQLLKEALSIFLQFAQQQMQPDQVEELAVKSQNILMKLDNLGVNQGGESPKPMGISDEWFNSVCKECEHLLPTGCEESVTKKFPGKCDPILNYEMKKAQSKILES